MCLVSVGFRAEPDLTFGDSVTDLTCPNVSSNLIEQCALSDKEKSAAYLDQLQTDRGRSYAERAERQGWGSCAAQVGGGGVVRRPEIGGGGG